MNDPTYSDYNSDYEQLISIQRTFPQNQAHYRYLKNVQQVQQRLNSQCLVLKVVNSFILKQFNEKYISFKCKNQKCTSQLQFDFTSTNHNQTKLVSFMNNHNHQIYENVRKLIRQQMTKLGQTCQRSSIIKILKQKYQIKSKYLQTIYSAIFNQPIDFTQYINQLKQQGFKVIQEFYPPEQGYDTPFPKFILAVSPLMVENFKKYGQFLGFDLTYNMIRDRVIITDSNSERNWGVGFFIGSSAPCRILPFGCVLTCDEKVQTFCKIFTHFFQFVGGQPNLIVTDEQIALALALKRLKLEGKYNGYHTMDMFHKLRSLRSKLQVTENLQFFRQLMKVKDGEEFQLKAKQSYDSIKNENDRWILRDFIRNAQIFCFCFLPKLLVGFHSSNSTSEKINDMVKTQIPYEMPLPKVFKIIMRYLDKLCIRSGLYEKEYRTFEILFQYPYLQVLRTFTAKPIFNRIIGQYLRGMKSQSLICGNYSVVITPQNLDYYLQFDGNKWICSCNYQIKTGVPCSHQLRVVEATHGSLLKYINDRWLLKQQNKEDFEYRKEPMKRLVNPYIQGRKRGRPPKFLTESKVIFQQDPILEPQDNPTPKQ